MYIYIYIFTLEAAWTYLCLKEASLVKKRGFFSKGKRPL